jgi:preprotein translocase subunit SecF
MPIIRNRKLFLAIGALIVITAGIIVATLGLKPSIDFTGGTLTEVRYSTMPEKSAIEGVLKETNLENGAIRESSGEFGASYIVTTRTLTVEEQKDLGEKLLKQGSDASIIRTTSIGPVIGQEMKSKAYWAIGAVLIVTIIYVAFAFVGIGKPVSSWIYGSFTVLVLFHDILVPIAVMSLLGYFWGLEVDVLFVTALLTILGYSVNDTIVIFDRVREKLVGNRTEHRKKIVEPGGIEHDEVTYTLTRPFGVGDYASFDQHLTHRTLCSGGPLLLWECRDTDLRTRPYCWCVCWSLLVNLYCESTFGGLRRVAGEAGSS